jgi:hypothetical protein
MSVQIYAVVDFVGGNLTDIVPISWIVQENGQLAAYWPPKSKLTKAVINRDPYSRAWQKCPVERIVVKACKYFLHLAFKWRHHCFWECNVRIG